MFIQTYRVWVLADDANGSPSILDFNVDCTTASHDHGDHYEVAKARAEERGYTSPHAFDEEDPAGQMMVKLLGLQSIKEQEEVPGPASAPLWDIPLTVDMSLSAIIQARGEDSGEAIRNAAEFASTKGYGLFSLDEGNYRGTSDFHVGDPAGVEVVDEATSGLAVDHAAAVEPLKESNVVKTVISVTVLHHKDEHPEGFSLAQIAGDIEDGDSLGAWTVQSQTLVPASRLHAEQIKVGNDGTFFPDDDAEESHDSSNASIPSER